MTDEETKSENTVPPPESAQLIICRGRTRSSLAAAPAPLGMCGGLQGPEQRDQLLTNQTPRSGFSQLEPAAPAASGRDGCPVVLPRFASRISLHLVSKQA